MTVGCIGTSGAGGGATAGATVGLCSVEREPDGSGGGAGGGTPVDPGDEGGGIAGTPADSGGGVLGTLAGGATGDLPLTGLPVWLVFLAGLALAGIGRVLYRRRSAGVADLVAH